MNELLGGLDLDESSDESTPQSNRIEQVILLLADAVWAVVGLALWIPQIVRVVITSAIRLVHAALTRQSIDGIRGPIRQVSRFYVDGFLSLGREKKTGNYGSRELHLGRFLIEALWVAAVWLAALRLISREAFASVWQELVRFATWAWGWMTDFTQTLVSYLPESVEAFTNLGTGAGLGLAFALTVFLAAGFILGRRRR
jgi:hypothetical protein